jgi:hypothetical protein
MADQTPSGRRNKEEGKGRRKWWRLPGGLPPWLVLLVKEEHEHAGVVRVISMVTSRPCWPSSIPLVSI